MEDFFNKKKYTSNDIQSLIDSKAEESLTLEFKDVRALGNTSLIKKEIGKDVSAFANSAGGIIIYGINEVEHVADSISHINGNDFSKEKLEQIINSRIHRRIEGLRIFPIRFEDDISKTVYLVKIPESGSAPHMVNNQYYKRYNFESIKMEEYEVRQLYYKSQSGVIEFKEPLIRTSIVGRKGVKIISLNCVIKVQIENTGTNIEREIMLELKIPELGYVEYISTMDKSFISEFFVRKENQHRVFQIPNKLPLFPDTITTIATINLRLNKKVYKEILENKISMRLYFTAGKIESEIDLPLFLKIQGERLELEDFN